MQNRTEIAQKTKQWFLISGVFTLVLGIMAVIVPLRSSLFLDVWIGAVFSVAGLIQAVHAFWSRKWGGFYFEACGGVLYLMVGMMLLANPGVGVQSVTLLLALLLVMQGMVQLSLSAELQTIFSKTWMFASGCAAMTLGILTWTRWPSSALWLVALFVGIHLLLRGWSIVTLALPGSLPPNANNLATAPEPA